VLFMALILRPPAPSPQAVAHIPKPDERKWRT
jgi:hypothetical protein